MKYHLYLDKQAVGPVDFGALVHLFVSGAITPETQIAPEGETDPQWQRLDKALPSVAFLQTHRDLFAALSELRNAAEAANRTASTPAAKTQPVVVTDFDINFWTLVWLLVKITIAAIPATFIVILIANVVARIFWGANLFWLPK